jgi:hypothetical protein
MADIVYTRKFHHDDWVDNQDVVQADGDRGFNPKFHALEAELDAISATFAVANTAVNAIQQLSYLTSASGITLAANSGSAAEIQVDQYSRDDLNLPPNVEQVYFVVILPTTSGPVTVVHTILYRPLPGNKINVTLTFYNPTAAAVTFAYRVLKLG